MATGTEIKEKISDLPVLPGSLRGFNVIGSKNDESGTPVSYSCDLGFVEDAADAASSAADAAQEKAALAQEKASEAETAADNADEKAQEATQAKTAIEATEANIEAAEVLRQQAEALRSEAETERAEAESEREEAEGSRETSEAARQQAEENRQTEETERDAAEQARESQASEDHTRAGEDHEQATEDHGTASSDHEQASSDHETASDDHSVAAGDHQTASSDHETATSDHSTAGTDHNTASGDHSRAESDHTQAASDHTQAGTDHAQATSDHQTAAADHTTASEDHTQAGSDHTQAASDHQTAAADHTTASEDHTAATQAIAACENTEEIIEAAELARTAAETARVNAEDAREVAETERQASETLRKQAERPFSRIDQVAGPMFDVTYPSLDYAYAKNYFENHAPEITPAGCSALVMNGILVRSYDWKRKTADGKTPCSFAVHTPAAQGHFAVVGMAGGLDALTEDVVEARQFSEAYKILPFCMLDGKNEKDLFAEMNVVPTWHNTRTVPSVEKRESISAMMLVRYILDNFQTVDEAVAYLQNYVEVYMPTNLDEMGYELHFLIADATKSVAIEFVDNAIVAIETDKLTNFHLSGVTLNEDGSVYTNADVADGNLPSSQGIEDYAGGLERFNILNAATDPVDAIKAVAFSKAYTDLVNVWFSEFVGGDITVNTQADDADFLARIAEYRQKWEDQDNDVWISVHQSVYRFGVAGLDVAIREGNDEHFVPISDHAQAQSDHSLAQSDHSTAQSDHVNEQARQAAETARQQAEVLRENAEDSRETAETARAAAEAARVTEEARRVAEYGQFELDINTALNCIEGQNDIPFFDEDTDYYVGQYVRRIPEGEDNAFAYRFISAHTAGPWNDEDVIQTSVFGELKQIAYGDTEVLHVAVTSTDGEMDINNISVLVQFADGGASMQAVTDENGECSFEILKGRTYTVSVQSKSGYVTPPPRKRKANTNSTSLTFLYSSAVTEETCAITVSVVKKHAILGNEPYADAIVNCVLSNGQTYSGTSDADGIVEFTVPRGYQAKVGGVSIAGYATPTPVSFSTDHSSYDVELSFSLQTAGLYMVRDDGAEIEFDNWDTEDTCVLFHIATQTLIDNNADFYVKPEHLASAWFTSDHNKQWATQNVNFPNVPTDVATDYNGSSNTTNMISDAVDLGIDSPAARFARGFTETINGIETSGFIGSKKQMTPLFDNNAPIYLMLTAIGLTGAYNNKNIWSSTQGSATLAWNWLSGFWNSNTKTHSNAVVPFFAI